MVKKILSLLFLSSFFFALNAQEGTTTVRFDSEVLDMGEYPSDSCVVTKVFTFTNTGRNPLYFYNTRPDCSCISISIPKKPVQPGEKGSIKVTFDGHAKPEGRFWGWIYFHSNTAPDYYRIRLQATKLPPLK